MITVGVDVLFGAIWFVLTIVLVGPIAWILKGAVADLKALEKDHEKLKTELPKDYVMKADHNRDMAEIKDLLRRIFEKLDGKADR